MKINLLTLTLLLCGVLLTAQQNDYTNNKAFASFDKDLNWVTLAQENTTSATSFFQQHYQAYGLKSPRDMTLVKENHDNLDWIHYRFHQYHKGIRVEGGTYILHEKNNLVIKANGQVYPNIQISTNPILSVDQILNQALTAFPAQRYAWENPVTETVLKRVKKNAQATHYPQPELVILDRSYPNSSGQYALAYKLIIYREAPVTDRRMLWYDAHSGELILNVNMMHDTNGEEGTAQTRYHGEQQIITMKESSGEYILRDTTRGGGIETYNDNFSEYGELAEFTDDDNFWENANEEQDEVATDVHFGTMVTYDFYWENFGRSSYDDQSSPMISMVHVGDQFNNAFWNGSEMSYGDGDSILFYPLTAIDVVGHEITHGVTEYSANLIYADESGALNESFSDIFGKTIEAIYTPDEFSWILGERMLVDKTNIFRSMEDPHRGDDPKYYQGELWVDGANVHTNSGVQNYWYYLLCEGEQGVNEAGYAYDIPAIGMDKAMRIAYRNLTTYLTESSGYKEARKGSLAAAADLYGLCSEEYLAVSEAWAVVGVGAPLADNDYEIDFITKQETACTIDSITVDISFSNNSCNTTLPSGTDIRVRYQLDDEAIVSEQVNLTNNLGPTEGINFIFSAKILTPSIGTHTIKAWIDLDNDPNPDNDVIEYEFENRVYQNEEFVGIRGLNFTGVCEPDTRRRPIGRINYDGCDSLPENTLVPFQAVYKDQVIDDTYRAFFPLATGSTIFTIENFVLTEYGFGEAHYEAKYPGDPTVENNFSHVFIGRIAEISTAWSEQFTGSSMDSTTLAIESAEHSYNAIQLVDNSHQLIMTGSDIQNDDGIFRINNTKDSLQFFLRNNDFHTTLHLCVDVQGYTNPALLFDFRQTKSDVDWSTYDINPDFATMLAVRVDNEFDTLLYGPSAAASQTYRLDLTDYTDASHEIRLIGLALQSSIYAISNVISLDGDNIIIDNIRLDLGTSTSIANNTIREEVTISPNPSNNSFILRRKGHQTSEKVKLSLIDATGKILLHQSLPGLTDSFEFGEDLYPGIYFLQIVDGEKSGYLKLIKQ